MNSAGKIAALLLLFGIAGCRHKVETAAQPAAPSRVYFPNAIANNEPMPPLPPPKPVEVELSDSEKSEQPAPAKPKRPAHHKKSTDAATTQTAKDTAEAPSAAAQEASAGQPADTSPIGQLSSATDSSSTLNRHQILDLITNTENGLNGIKRVLSSDEQQTATQIRTFLTKAKKALDEDDLDGANTLVTKAKVLLDELTKG